MKILKTVKESESCGVNNTYCCVPQCKNGAWKDKNLSFHLFPKVYEFWPKEKQESTLKRRNAWIRVLRIGKTVSDRMVICSDHFQKSDYILPNVPTQRPSLKKNAIPSQKLPVYSLESGEKTLEASMKICERENLYAKNCFQCRLQNNEVVSCSAFGCKNRWNKNKKIMFHRFPLNDPERLQKWLIGIRRKSWQPSKCSMVCSVHFTADSYKSRQRHTLKNDAVPTLIYFHKAVKKKTAASHLLPVSVKKYEAASIKGLISEDSSQLKFTQELSVNTQNDAISVNGSSPCEAVLEEPISEYSAHLKSNEDLSFYARSDPLDKSRETSSNRSSLCETAFKEELISEDSSHSNSNQELSFNTQSVALHRSREMSSSRDLLCDAAIKTEYISEDSHSNSNQDLFFNVQRESFHKSREMSASRGSPCDVAFIKGLISEECSYLEYNQELSFNTESNALHNSRKTYSNRNLPCEAAFKNRLISEDFSYSESNQVFSFDTQTNALHKSTEICFNGSSPFETSVLQIYNDSIDDENFMPSDDEMREFSDIEFSYLEDTKQRLDIMTAHYKNMRKKFKVCQQRCNLYKKEIVALKEVILTLKQINSVTDENGIS